MSEFPRSGVTPAITTELIERLPFGVVVYHLDDDADPGSLRLVRANKAASVTLGYDLETEMGLTIGEATPRVLDTEIPSMYASVARSGTAYDLGEIEYEDDRVERSVFRVSAFPLPDRHVGVIFEKMLKRQSTEAARYRALVEASAQIVWETKPNGEIADMPQWRAYTGQSVEEVRGLGWLDAIHPDDRERSGEAWNRTVESRGRTPYDIEYRVRGADGVYRWFNARGVPILDADDAITEWVGVCEEIDERKRAEEELADSEARYRFMSETLQQQIWTAHPDGQLDYVNHYVLDYFGRTYDEMIGKGWQGVVHEDDLPLVVERWTRALETGEPYEVEFRLRCSDDGSWRWHIGRASALRDESGQIVKWFGANTDINEKKRMEEVLAEANRKLEERVADRTQALAAFTEDLKALHRITTAKHSKPEDFFQDYLRAGCVIFELPIGILSETPLLDSGERRYRLHTVESPLAELSPGLEVHIEEAFCDAVVERSETVSYADAAEVEELACHVAYTERGLRAFIGTPIYVDDELFGTLNFVSPEPRAGGFAPHEHELIEVMAELVGRLLSAHRAERKRIETDARYRSVVETIEEGLLLVDAEGKILMSNPAATFMLGLSDDATVLGRVAGAPRWPLVDEDGRALADDDLPERTVLRTGQSVTGAIQGVVYPDGSTRWVSVNARAADYDDEGNVSAVAISFVDVTEIRAAEGRIRATNAFLQQTLDALGSHIAILDENFTILAVNAAWRRFGEENDLASEGHIVGSSYLGPREAGTEAAVGNDIADGLHAVLHGERDRFEVEYPRHSLGEERWFLFRATRFEGFDELRLVVAHEDITELKQAERGLRSSEAQLQKAQEIAQVGSWRWDIASDGIEWSDELFRIFGVAPDEFDPSYEKYLTRVHEDDREKLSQAIERAVNERTTYEVDHRVLRPDGQVRHIHGIGEVVLGPDGETVALQGTAQDVTEAYEARRAMERLSRRLEQILESAGEGIYGLALDGTTTFVNHAAADMIGWDPDDLLGKSQHDVLHHHRADGSVYPVTECPIYHTLRDGQERRITGEVFWRKDGTSFPVEYVTAPMQANDEVVGAVVVFQDITERVRAQQELRGYADQLEERNAELEQFAYVASHDLQEPLRMVSSFLQLLQRRYEGQLDETADEYIGYAVDGASRMKILIQNLLAYSRIGTRGKPFEPVEMGHVVENVLNDLSVAIGEARANVEVGPLPTTQADRTQLGQLFQNLIGNAVKFSGEAPPEVQVSAERTEHARTDGSEAPGWRFAVTDNGIGIADEHAERIFQIFQRLHTRDEYEGTGIGLAMCKKIVERHGGRIWIESQPGEGATFYFTLPDNPPTLGDRAND